jgi:hypothetical protein
VSTNVSGGAGVWIGSLRRRRERREWRKRRGHRGTTPGSYAITVTGALGSVTRTVEVELTVQ